MTDRVLFAEIIDHQVWENMPAVERHPGALKMDGRFSYVFIISIVVKRKFVKPRAQSREAEQ